MDRPHVSVLKDEVVSAFADTKLHVYVDGTLGAGGHASVILQEHSELDCLIGIDQDPIALSIAQKRLDQWRQRIRFEHGNASELLDIVQRCGFETIDGMLLDLGTSSMQLDTAERGFSFSKEGPLDMRMDPRNPLTAEEIVNTWSEGELGRIFREYGEEKRWRAAARAIVKARTEEPLTTTSQLVKILDGALYRPRGRRDLHPATLIFQALRIAINDELGALAKVLEGALQILRPGGRLAVISFHSLEDRVVKRCFQYAASDKENTSGMGGMFVDKAPTVKVITRKPIVPSEEECRVNPRSRSSKMRVVEKLEAPE